MAGRKVQDPFEDVEDNIPRRDAAPPSKGDLLDDVNNIPHRYAAPPSKGDLREYVTSIEVEAVVCGCLQRIRLQGINPAETKAYLQSLDPNAQVRDAFPSKGFGGGGGRDTKLARVVSITAKAGDSGKYIEMLCDDGADTIIVKVSRKSADGFLDALKAVGKVSEIAIGKIQRAFDEKTKAGAAVILGESEQFGVKYWSGDDGTHFMDSLVSDAPKSEVAA